MKAINLVLLVILLSQPAYSTEVGYKIDTRKTFPGKQDINPNFMIGTSGTDYIFASTKSDKGTNGKSTALITKVRNSGELLWEKEVSLENHTTPKTSLTLKDGFLVIGHYDKDQNPETPHHVFISKFSQTGKMLFTKSLKTTAHIYTAITSFDGNIVIGGIYSDSGYGGCSYLSKLSLTGELIWEKTYLCSKGENGVSSVVETSTGNFIALGYIDSDISIFAIDAKGKLIWDKKYTRGVNTGVKLIKEGKEYLALAATDHSGQPNPSMYLLRINEDGEKISDKSIPLQFECTDIGHISFTKALNGYLLAYTARNPAKLILIGLDKALNVTFTNTWDEVDRVSDVLSISKNKLTVIGRTHQNATDMVTILNLVKAE